MRNIREVLRLRHLKHSERQIATSCHISKGTVGTYLKRAIAAGITWPIPEDLDDLKLERTLYAKHKPDSNPDSSPDGNPDQVEQSNLTSSDSSLDWQQVHLELKRKGVTRFLLWKEYQQRNPPKVTLSYSTYARQYRFWKAQQNISQRQIHKAGEKVFGLSRHRGHEVRHLT
jgi:transposase